MTHDVTPRPPISTRACALALAFAGAALAGCGHDHGTPDDYVLVRQDDASDEVLLALLDAEAAGAITISDARAARLMTPTNGQLASADEPIVFSWGLPSVAGKTPRHGIATGRFVWLTLTSSGLAKPIHVLSIGSTTWDPGEWWADLVASGAPIHVTITTAYAEAGLITEGPFRPSGTTTFTITP